MELNVIQKIAVYAIPVLFAITLHEAAHGFVAKRFGDLTAYAQGRVSLNPLRHVDLMGTIVVPLVLLVLSKLTGGSGILFGWAKPVPVNFGALRRPKQDMLWVAVAGPAANFVMALAWGLAIKVGLALDNGYALPLQLMGAAGLFINVMLMVLNLVPLPPLDGGRIAVSVLPHRAAYAFARLERFGFIILIALLFTGVLGFVMWPVIGMVITLVTTIFDLPPAQVMRLFEII